MEIKLVIWDLDDTLWTGTLAEGDKVILNQEFAEIIKALNIRGVVSSICSKNDEDQARRTLTEFGLWDQFVFPYISFTPKGEAVSTMIEQMQLRPQNVLFIDDNTINLEEVRAREPEINIADTRLPATLDLLKDLVRKYDGVRKSRIEKYRALEARQRDWKQNAGSREEFLRSCDITMAIVEATDNVAFVGRIEELINRTNQMNFTKSRVEPGSLSIPFAVNANVRPYAIFVWDKYGHHGLVGFAMVENKRLLRHFVFSCRIMHMGVEQRVLHELTRHRDVAGLDISNVAVTPAPVDWIKLVKFSDPEVRAKILAAETKKGPAEFMVRIMANCQSAALAHFAGIVDVADTDAWPRTFNLQYFATGIRPPARLGLQVSWDGLPPSVVYGAFAEYLDDSWVPEVLANLESGAYRECAAKFAAFVRDSNRRMMVLLPPAEGQFFTEHVRQHGGSVARFALFNTIWEEIAAENRAITVLRTGTSGQAVDIVARPEEFGDAVHFRPPLLQRVGEHIAAWLAAPVSDAAEEALLEVLADSGLAHVTA